MFPSPEKTKYMLYGRGHSTLDLGLTFDGSHISKEPFIKILGVNFGYSSQVAAEWVKSISRQWRHGLHLVRRISHRLGGAGERIAKILVTSVLASKVAYAARFYSLKRVHFDKIATLYNEARRTILGLPRHTRTSELRKCLHLVDLRETLEQQLDIHMARLEHTLHGRAVARFIGVAVTNINDLPPTKPPWDLIDLTQHARPVPRNMDAKRHAKRREHYARQHQAEVTALSQDPAQVIVYTDAALHTSGWSATAAVFPSHDPAQYDPIVVANTNMTPSSPEQAEARAVLLALQTYEVCNTVTYPAVFYKAQAVCCPGLTAKKIHKSWATFVWRSPWERTRRDNLFLHQESGGLGLVDIVIKLNVQRFLLFRNAKEPTLLSALHHLGFPCLGRWMVSTSGLTAKAAALRFYSEIAEAILFFLVLFS
ncbi:hypothetical protein ISCGN_030000 [Ixodes scapularis]